MWGDDALRDAKGQVERAGASQAEQLEFLPTPEEMSEAHHVLSQDTRNAPKSRDVLAEARRRGVSRKPTTAELDYRGQSRSLPRPSIVI